MRGTVAGAATVTSPSGRSGTGYVGWIRASEQRKDGVRCTIAVLDGLEIRTDDGTLRLAASAPPWALDGSFARSPETVLAIETGKQPPPVVPIPPAVVASPYCAKPAKNETAAYREVVLSPGDQVDVVACREGATLRPCKDGFDVVAVGSADPYFARNAQSGGLELMVGFAVGLVGLVGTLLGGLKLAEAVRARKGEAQA